MCRYFCLYKFYFILDAEIPRVVALVVFALVYYFYVVLFPEAIENEEEHHIQHREVTSGGWFKNMERFVVGFFASFSPAWHPNIVQRN